MNAENLNSRNTSEKIYKRFEALWIHTVSSLVRYIVRFHWTALVFSCASKVSKTQRYSVRFKPSSWKVLTKLRSHSFFVFLTQFQAKYFDQNPSDLAEFCFLLILKKSSIQLNTIFWLYRTESFRSCVPLNNEKTPYTNIEFYCSDVNASHVLNLITYFNVQQ